MAHYSEMSFLFDTVASTQVTQVLNQTSQNNKFNVFKGDDSYVVYKNKTKTGTNNIKQYLSDTIYKQDNTKNPYLRLLDDFGNLNGMEGAGLRLKAADFAYLRDLGVYPINRMAILRRFPEGCMVPENLEEMTVEPISTVIGWIKPDANFGKVEFSESWGTTNKRFDQMLNEIIKKSFGGIDISALIPIPDFAQGVLFEFYNKAGVTGENNAESINEAIETFNGISSGGNDGGNWGLYNIPVGNPNILQEAPFRDPLGQSIKSNFQFELTTVYEQKLLGDVDPGSVMLDILDNLYAMGTSNMLFYWNDSSKSIQDATRAAISGGANNPYSWWIFVQSLMNGFWKGIQDLFNDVRVKIEEVVQTATNEGAKAALNKGIMPILTDIVKTILTSTIAIHRFELRGSMELMVGGKYSSSPWHLMLGNPYSPWIATNHIVVKSCAVETSTEMGFNDQPQTLTATFTCEFSRSLGKQELMRMFNNTYRRTYNKATSTKLDFGG